MFPRIASPRFLALAGTVVLWASAFPAIRLGIDGLGVAGLSFLRLGVAALALMVVAPFTKVRLPRRRDLPMIALCGATGMTAYQVLLNWGEVHVEAGTASLLIPRPRLIAPRTARRASRLNPRAPRAAACGG